MSKTWTIYFLLLVTTTLSANTNQGPYQKCGRYLTALIAMVCESRYNTPILNKRSIPPLSVLDLMDPNALKRGDVPPEPRQLSLGDILLPRKLAIQVLRGKRRVKRGVYDECCKKPCTYSELYGYCAPR